MRCFLIFVLNAVVDDVGFQICAAVLLSADVFVCLGKQLMHLSRKLIVNKYSVCFDVGLASKICYTLNCVIVQCVVGWIFTKKAIGVKTIDLSRLCFNRYFHQVSFNFLKWAKQLIKSEKLKIIQRKRTYYQRNTYVIFVLVIRIYIDRHYFT